jgi:general secretion pathway protein M
MRTWWQGLVMRERVLIAVAGALTFLVVIWQFVLAPALDARASAKANMQVAAQRLTVLQEAYQAKRVVGETILQAQDPLNADAFKAAITGSATDKGLSIARLQAGRGNSVGIIFESADPRLVFFWLNDVETRLGGRVSRLTMEQSGKGDVRVNVEIESPVS